MNIFYLDTDPVKCAEMHCDKHIVKMILEYAQLLSTAHRVLDGEQYTELSKTNRKIKRWKMNTDFYENTLYKATHINHPSAIWVRESISNYNWLYKLFIQLCFEYTIRFGKEHLTFVKLGNILSRTPINIPEVSMTEIPQAMPDYCKNKDTIIAYRTYYIKEKTKLLKYTKRQSPNWISNVI